MFLLEPLKVLRKHPVLFLPRIVLNVLWSLSMILVGRALFLLDLRMLRSLILPLFALAFVDVWVSAAYPILYRQYKEGRISFGSAMLRALRRVPGLAGLYAVLMIPLLPFSFLFSEALVLCSMGHCELILPASAALLAVLLAITFLFYFSPVDFVYGKSFLRSLADSPEKSFQHFGKTIVATTVSVLLLIFGLLGEKLVGPAGYLPFLCFRLLKGVLATYDSLLTPSLYHEVVE